MAKLVEVFSHCDNGSLIVSSTEDFRLLLEMYKIGEEELVLCPYNNHHVVGKLRIQKHIINCQKKNPHVKLATCFYNYSHRIKPEELLAHYEICPNKTRIDGARYGEFSSHPKSAASKSDFLQKNFPDIHTKTHFFSDPPFFTSNPSQEYEDDSQKLEISGSESEGEDFHLKSIRQFAFETDFSSHVGNIDSDNVEQEKNFMKDKIIFEKNYYDEEEDDELEPLPLPKTVSKAFVYSKEQASKPLPVKPSQFKPFARGKGLLAFSPPKEQRKTDHLLPDLSDMDSDLPKRKNSPKFFSKKMFGSCNESVVSSSMFDDTATLQSEEIVFDDEFVNDDNSGFILKNFDKYTKI